LYCYTECYHNPFANDYNDTDTVSYGNGVAFANDYNDSDRDKWRPTSRIGYSYADEYNVDA
jgi:hypothetical protein